MHHNGGEALVNICTRHWGRAEWNDNREEKHDIPFDRQRPVCVAEEVDKYGSREGVKALRAPLRSSARLARMQSTVATN
jgi:hypothetical protein